MGCSDQDPTQVGRLDCRQEEDVYEIKIKGLLDEHWKAWFEGLTLQAVEDDGSGQSCTLIIGSLVDQPALHGLLEKNPGS